MHNFPNGMDVQQTKKNIRQLLFEQALVKKPKPIWPGFDCSSYSTDSDLYTAWIESWYSPLSMLLSANQLQVTLPNPFFSTPFHAHAKAFFQDAVSKVNLELFINNFSDSPHSAKYQKPADLDQQVVTSCLDAFLLNTKNEYSVKTLRKFCTSELNVSQIILRGPTGSGKTFLLNAVIDDFRIGSSVSSRYLNCSQFQDICRNDCQYSSEKINPSAFQCLAVDDIHLLAQDQAAQIKLAQIMDNLALHGQRLVLSALWDSSVEDPLAKLLPELKSRLSLGLVLFLQEPDLDIRLRYVKQLFSRKNMPLPQDFLLYLARRCQDLRQLQGITEQIALFWAHTGQLPDEHYLGNMLRSSGGGDILNPDAVMAIVAAKYGCQARDLRGDKRTPNLVQARQIAMFLCRELLGESYPNLGKAFGGKDHSTVMYAVKKIKKMQITNKEMNNLLAQLTLECSKYGG